RSEGGRQCQPLNRCPLVGWSSRVVLPALGPPVNHPYRGCIVLQQESRGSGEPKIHGKPQIRKCSSTFERTLATSLTREGLLWSLDLVSREPSPHFHVSPEKILGRCARCRQGRYQYGMITSASAALRTPHSSRTFRGRPHRVASTQSTGRDGDSAFDTARGAAWGARRTARCRRCLP